MKLKITPNFLSTVTEMPNSKQISKRIPHVSQVHPSFPRRFTTLDRRWAQTSGRTRAWQVTVTSLSASDIKATEEVVTNDELAREIKWKLFEERKGKWECSQ